MSENQNCLREGEGVHPLCVIGGVSDSVSLPEIVEPGRRQLGVPCSVGNRNVAEPRLDRPGVVSGVGKGIAATMPEHVRVNLYIQPGLGARPGDQEGEPDRGERPATFRNKHEVGMRGAFPLEAT